jgi:hypothetical protein
MGLDTPVYREKLNFLLLVMRVHGKIWPISREIADEVRFVAQDYCILQQSSSPEPGSVSSHTQRASSSAATDDVAMPMSFDPPDYHDFANLNFWTDPSDIAIM